MPLPTFYNSGTASVENGETTVTFAGAGLGTAEFPFVSAGDLFFDPAQPAIPGQRLASVDYGAGTAVLWAAWPGTTMVGDAFEIRFVDDAIRSTAQTRRYLERLGQLAALGIQPNAFGEFADRDTYDGEAKGFIFLSLNGDAGATTEAWTLYAKLSAADADWDDGQSMEGAPGAKGDKGDKGVKGDTGDTGATGPANELTIGTVESGPAADAEITGAAPEQVLNLTLPKGDTGDDGWSPVLAIASDGARRVAQVVDWAGGEGTKPTTGLYVGATGLTATIGDAVDIRGPAGSGTGDVNTAGSVTIERLARYADGTGDAIEDAGVTVADVLSRANHTGTQAISTVTGLQTALDGKALPSDITAAINGLINAAPGALDTLDELAAALGDDANFAATMTTALAGKQPLDSDLTAIAALTTTSYGRAFLALANQAALMALLLSSSTTVQGIVELATAAEYRTGTDTARALGVAEAWGSAVPVNLGATLSGNLSLDYATLIHAYGTATGNIVFNAVTNPKNQAGIIRITASGGDRTVGFTTSAFATPDNKALKTITSGTTREYSYSHDTVRGKTLLIDLGAV